MITAGSGRSSLRALWGPLVLAALVTLTQAGGPDAIHLLAYDRALVGQGEAWRLVTGSFIHLSWYHWLLDVIGLVALVVLCPEMPLGRVFFLRVVVLSLGMSVALYAFAPRVTTCVGLSGVLHGMFLLGLLPVARRGDLIAAGCLAFLVAKLAWETIAGGPVSDAAAIGGHVVTESHLFGTLAAFVYGLAARPFRKKPER